VWVSQVGDCLTGYAISGESQLTEEPPLALCEVDRPGRNSEKGCITRIWVLRKSPVFVFLTFLHPLTQLITASLLVSLLGLGFTGLY